MSKQTPVSKEMGLECNWKSYGFFRTMGRGYRFIIKNTFL